MNSNSTARLKTDTFATTGTSAVAKALGPLPPYIRYFDEYDECIRSFDSDQTIWEIDANGAKHKLHFELCPPDIAHILKHFCLNRIQKNATTASFYCSTIIRTIEVQLPMLILACEGARSTIAYLKTDLFSISALVSDGSYFVAAKALLHFFCEAGISDWDASFANILRSVSSPRIVSKHRSVRNGSAIISLAEERELVDYFDQLNIGIVRKSFSSMDPLELRNASILFWNYAHGMRPIQIANRNANPVRLRHQEDGNPIVHLTFRYAKQRSKAKLSEQTRKMKRDWTPMLEEWLRLRSSIDRAQSFDRFDSLFGVSPGEITTIVADMTMRITGVRRVPYDLRCVFHAMAGIDSTGSWAAIPREGGQSFHGIVGRFDRQSNGIGFLW